LTYGGLLAFGRSPGNYLPQARVHAVRFTDQAMESYSDSKLFTGPVGAVIDEVEGYLAANLREVGGHWSGFKRGRLLEYPISALREAVVNAVAHRNYLDPSDVKLFILPGEIRIKNPGAFPPGVTPEDPEHKPRNPLLTGFLFDLGYVERYGFGITRIRQECDDHPLVSVSFRSGVIRTEVVFTRTGKDLDAADQQILGRLGGGPCASGELAAHLGVTRQAINPRLRRLVSLGLVVREGRGPATRYRL